MMTLIQWQNTRRVDHVGIAGAHVRFRGNAGPGLQNLKAFDADVTAYWQAQEPWAKVTALSAIVQETSVYLAGAAGQVDQRYLTAVQNLLNSAQADLSILCGAAYQPARTADLITLRNPHPALAARVSNINVIYLTPMGGAAPNVGPVDAIIDAHIATANAMPCYQRANLTIQRTNAAALAVSQTAAGNSILMPAAVGVPPAQVGKFADGGEGGRRLIEYCNGSGGAANSIDVVYLDHYETGQADVQGRTYRAGNLGVGVAPTRPIVTITLNPPPGGAGTYPTTFAHELGHALTGEGGHVNDANNLMSSGAIRNGVNSLTDGHIAWFRNNPWT